MNHEYVSNNEPSETSAPTGQALQLAHMLKSQGLILGSVPYLAPEVISGAAPGPPT